MAKITYRDAVGKALQDSMRNEPRLVIIGQNLTGHALKALAETYGTQRVRDCSISESAMVGMAVGAAMKGMKVVVMIAYADSLRLSYGNRAKRGQATLSQQRTIDLPCDHSPASCAIPRSWTARQ